MCQLRDMHVTHLLTVTNLTISGKYIWDMGEEDHSNTEQADQSSDAKPVNADSRHICQSWHLKTHNLQIENNLRMYTYIV